MINVEEAKKIMQLYDLDVLIATAPKNVFYISELWTNGFCIYPMDGEPTLLAPIMKAYLQAEEPSIIRDVRFYGWFHVYPASDRRRLTEKDKRFNELVLNFAPTRIPKDSSELLDRVIKEKKLKGKKIGIERKDLDYELWEKVKKALGDGKIVDGTPIFDKIRAVKTGEEIRRLRKAVRITEKGFDKIESNLREGITEIEMNRLFNEVLISEGISPRWGIFAIGEMSAYIGTRPTSRKLNKGEMTLLHSGCSYKHYSADIARVLVLGRPNRKLKKYWKATSTGVKRLADEIRPGVKACELFKMAVNTIRQSGIPYYERWHTGHGIGIETSYDKPIIAPEDDTTIKKRMTFCLETPYYEIGFGGINLEHQVVVRTEGAEFLTTPNYELREV